MPDLEAAAWRGSPDGRAGFPAPAPTPSRSFQTALTPPSWSMKSLIKSICRTGAEPPRRVPPSKTVYTRSAPGDRKPRAPARPRILSKSSRPVRSPYTVRHALRRPRKRGPGRKPEAPRRERRSFSLDELEEPGPQARTGDLPAVRAERVPKALPEESARRRWSVRFAPATSRYIPPFGLSRAATGVRIAHAAGALEDKRISSSDTASISERSRRRSPTAPRTTHCSSLPRPR